eukprot:gb/GECG01009333.1/.p1 GENE.gb/GECG01009333.1/~~gb/GECG01009333.1/.p1  ORF type:complete len:307 (+),score=28.39 gb/GECG01009333.1/:1-921(+)
MKKIDGGGSHVFSVCYRLMAGFLFCIGLLEILGAAAAVPQSFVLGRDGYGALSEGVNTWWRGYRIRVNYEITVTGLYASAAGEEGISMALFNVSVDTLTLSEVLASGTVSLEGRHQLVAFDEPVTLFDRSIYAIAQGRESGNEVVSIDVEKLLQDFPALASWEPRDGDASFEVAGTSAPQDIVGYSFNYSDNLVIPDIGMSYIDPRFCPGNKVFNGSQCICTKSHEFAPTEESICRSCGNGSMPTLQQDACIKCRAGQVSGPNESNCFSCPRGQTPNAEHSHCVTRIQRPTRTVGSALHKVHHSKH